MTETTPREQILVAMAPKGVGPMGNVWRLTAKRFDFYLDPASELDELHLSMHGPNADCPDGHRFHVKVNRKAAETAHDRGKATAHGIPRRGFAFTGTLVEDDAFLVARVRWTWDILRERYRSVVGSGPLPEIRDAQSGRVMRKPVDQNYAVDMDVVVAVGRPVWLGGKRSIRDNARLGPLHNEADLWLTATMIHRWQAATPTPPGLAVPHPRPDDEPNRILLGGPGAKGTNDIYWFVETVTTRRVIEDSQRAWQEQRESRRGRA